MSAGAPPPFAASPRHRAVARYSAWGLALAVSAAGACGDDGGGTSNAGTNSGTAGVSASGSTGPSGQTSSETDTGSSSGASTTTGTGLTGTTSSSGGSTDTGIKFDLPVPDGGDDTDTDTDTGAVDESTCEAAAQSLTSAGCLFAPIVTKPNNLPWAVIAANTGDVEAVATLFDPNGAELEAATIQPGELHIFEFANTNSWAIDSSTTKGTRALRLESDRPVVAYQFLPYSSSQVATSDAALLLPEHAWGDNYLALVPSNDGSKWLTVVSLEDNNEVKVYISEGADGSTAAGGGVPAMAPGGMHTEVLGAQDVLRISAGQGGDPISGAAVYSSAPVAVYVGSPGMSLPGPGFQGWQDSIEEQIQPRAAWGTEYAVVKFRPRGGEGDLYRIIADKDGTVVTLSGDYQDQFNLDEGEFVEFLTAESFYASGNEAFLVGHYLVSASENSGMKDDDMYPGWFTASNNCGDGPTSPNSLGDLGDPAIGFIPPVDQFRSRYTFLTPDTYSWDMVTVVAQAGGWGTITLDEQPLPEPTPLNGGDMVYARFLVEDGPHYIESPSHKFGIEVYGYDCRISYVYPGGLSLGSINVPPPPPG